MNTSGIFWRILIAVIGVTLTFALIPPICRIIGFTPTADIMLVVRICVAGIAIYYILRGSNPPWVKVP